MAPPLEEHGQKATSYEAHSMIFDRKFNVALRKSHGDLWTKRVLANTLTPEDNHLLLAARLTAPDLCVEDVKVNTNLFPDIYLDLTRRPRYTKALTTRIYPVLERLVSVQLHWLTEAWTYTNQPDFTMRIKTAVDKAAASTILGALIVELGPMTDIITRISAPLARPKDDETPDDYKKRCASMCSTRMTSKGYSLVWSQTSVLLRFDTQWYYLPKSYILMIHNKLADLVSVLLYAAFTPYETYRANLLYLTTKFLDNFAECATLYNQQFFRLSKLVEAVGIGLTLEDTEGHSNIDFLETVCKASVEHIGCRLDKLSFVRLMRDVSIEVRHELMCLSKTMGHPFCDIEQGARDLKKKVTSQKDIDPALVHESVLRAKEDFVKHYFKKHKKWPPCTISPDLDRRLAQIILRNRNPRETNTIRKYGLLDHTAFEYIDLLPIKEFDWVDNFIPYIKDRTISVLRSEVLKKYMTHEETRISWKDTRLLLFYLLRPASMTNHRRYIEAYMRGNWEQLQDYLVIRIVPKEKEHKIEARGFGCKTYMDRTRSIIQEHNTAGILNDYSSEHVMTLDELGLAKKLLSFRRMQQAHVGYRMLIVSVDASSWNNAFRGEAIHPMLSETLDKLHGVNIWDKTQTAYQKTFVYMPDTAEVHSWEGQDGGIEGLNQYTWVYAYIHQIKVCLKDQPYPYYILCKGDDLRVAVMVAPEVLENLTIDELKVSLLNSVSDIGKKFGHTIKVEDSYASESYFAFSKDAYVNDAEQSQAMRKIQKCYGANNAFLNLVDDYISSALSNAHSTSKVCPSPITAYLVGAWWALYSLVTHSQYKLLTDWQLVGCLLIPNMLGGFPIIYLHNMFVRAESDLLPPFVSLCQFAARRYPQLAEVLIRAWSQNIAPVDKSLPGLMVDIYSIPITKPSSAATILRREMSKLIEEITENENVTVLFRASKRRLEKTILETFLQSNVYNVKLMSALYDCLPEALIRELVRKFESGKSIYLALLRGRGGRRALAIIKAAYRADIKLQKFRLQLITRGLRTAEFLLPSGWEHRCPGEICQEVRDALWEKPVIGVTQPPPQHQVYGGDADKIPPTHHNLTHHFELWHTHPSGPLPHLLSVGKDSPFVGAITGKGLSKPKASLEANNIITSKIRTLVEVYQWSRTSRETADGTVIVGNLGHICEALLKDYTGYGIAHFLPYAGDTIVNKTVQHHVRASNYRAAVVPNTLLNIYTTMKGNIYAHHFLKQSLNHYRVNYLQIFCHMVSLTALPWWVGEGTKLTRRVWGVTADCQWCMAPLEEIPVVIPTVELPDSGLQRSLKVSQNEIAAVRHEIATLELPDVYEPTDEVTDETVAAARQGICEYAVQSIWAQRNIIQVSTTGHHQTGAAASVLASWFGETAKVSLSVQDIRSIPLDRMISAIAPLIYYYILEHYTEASDEAKIAVMSTEPAEELPWFLFLSMLQDAMVLFELQAEVQRQCPQLKLAHADSPRAYTHAFGRAAFMIQSCSQLPKRLILMSYLETNELSHTDRLRINLLRWHVVDHTLGRALRHARETGARDLIIRLNECILSLGLIDDDDYEATVPRGGGDLEMPLFPPLAEVEEIIEAGSYPLDECDHPSINDRGMERCEFIYEASGFLQLMVSRYGLGWVTSQVYFNLVSQDPARHAARYAEALQTLEDPTIIINHMDPVTCLNLVKLSAEERDMVDIEAYEARERNMIRMGRPQGVHAIFIRPEERSCSFHTPPTDEELPQIQRANPFSPGPSYRPVGMGNPSMSKALSVFQQLKIVDLPQDSLYLCLGDGYGGYTAVVSALTRGSRIVYSTKPTNVGVPPLPLEAKTLAERQGNTVDTSALELDIYDLTSEQTVIAYERTYKRAALITCDAECPTLTDGRYFAARSAMVKNVIRIFTSCGDLGTIMILKVYSHEHQIWFPAVRYLTTVASPVICLHNAASYLDGEMYIVACLHTRKPLTTPYIERYPAQGLQKKLCKFLQRMSGSYNAISNELILCTGIHLSARLSRAAVDLPCYGWMKLSEVLKITCDPVLQHGISPDVPRWKTQVLTMLRPTKDALTADLRQGPSGPRSVVYDTLAHKMMMLDRLTTLTATMQCISSTQDGTLAIDRPTSMLWFRNFLMGLPMRAGIRAKLEQVLEGPFMIRTQTFNIKVAWEQGLQLGISILCYRLLHHQ